MRANTAPSARGSCPASCGCCHCSMSSWKTSTLPDSPTSANTVPASRPTHRCSHESIARSLCRTATAFAAGAGAGLEGVTGRLARVCIGRSEAVRPVRAEHPAAAGEVVLVAWADLRAVVDVLVVEHVLDAHCQRAHRKADV